MATPDALDREALVRRGLWLNYATIAYNSLEAVVSLVAGVLAGSVALVGFGIDSVIEVTASGAAQWRLRADLDHERRDRVERVTLRVIGWSFIALAAYVAIDSATSLWYRERPERSVLGTMILALSVVNMPALARAKRGVARALTARRSRPTPRRRLSAPTCRSSRSWAWRSTRLPDGGGAIHALRS